MDPREDLNEDLEESLDEEEYENPDLEPEEMYDDTSEEYDGYSSSLDQARSNINQRIRNNIRDKADKKINERIENGRQQQLKQKSIREAKKREEEIAKKTAKKTAENTAKKTAENAAKKTVGEGAKKAVQEGAKQAGKAIGTALKAAGQAIANAVGSSLASLLANPYFWAVVGVVALVIAMVVIIIIILNPQGVTADDCQRYYKQCYGTTSSSDPATTALSGANASTISKSLACVNYENYCKNQYNNTNSSKEMGSLMSMTHTKHTKEEFVAACDAQAEKTSSDIIKGFYAKCGYIYDEAIKQNLNPEVIVARAYAEGFSPATQGYPEKNNYYGIGCNNGSKLSKCTSYSSLEDGVAGFFKIQSKYDTIEEMMGVYAQLDYWRNPGNSGDGGCYYLEDIKPYLSEARYNEVATNYCAKGKECDGSACTPVNEEDALAYQKYQVQDNMVKYGNLIFGSVTPGGMVGLAKFPVRDTKPDWLSAPDSNYYTDTINGSNYFQCVWYAKARAVEILSTIENADSSKANDAITAIKSSGAHGSGWYNLAQGDGAMSIFGSSNDVNSPRPGAMISWKWNENGCKAYNGYNCTEYGGTQTNYGHVAIIESVDYDNQKVVVSDGWHNCSDWNSSSCFGFRSKEYSFSELESFGGNYIFNGYVYVADYVGG